MYAVPKFLYMSSKFKLNYIEIQVHLFKDDICHPGYSGMCQINFLLAQVVFPIS